MAHDESQIFVPDSYLALYRDQRQRLTASKESVLAGYGMCEDMAQMLVDHCQDVHLRDGVDEQQVLERCHAGLMVPGLVFTGPQAEWVIRRTAELLGWQLWVPDFSDLPGHSAGSSACP